MLKRIRCYRAATRIDDVIGPCSIPRNTAGTRSRQHIQVEIVADPPRNHMIRAGGISAQAEAADNPIGVVEAQTSAKDIHAADLTTDHRVVSLTVVRRRSFIRNRHIDGIAFLKAEQAAARLDGAMEVPTRQRQTIEAEGIRGIGFLRGNHPTARPLIAPVDTGKCYSADHAIPIYDGRPHIEIEPARFGSNRGIERGLQRRVIRKSTAILLGCEYRSRSKSKASNKRKP